MSLGPVELIVIEFPDGKLDKRVAPALKEIVDNGTIRIIDLLFVKKDDQGKTTIVELEDSGIADSFKDVDGEVLDLVNANDVKILAAGLANGSAAALVVWENTWATKFAEAVRASKGRIVENLRIPHSAVEAAIQALKESKSTD
ncbi:MAG: DUF6325 family protein [Candidatus Brachytrichaceae bacterium NZ_4S206]|jgi:uncharacterized membrane protein